MGRNYKLDLYKGIAAISILWIHIGTFVSPPDTFFLNYTRSLTSIAVPLFFIISGYFIAKSRDLKPGTIKLFKIYFLMVIFTAMFYYLFVGNMQLKELLLRFFYYKIGSVGYLWFIKMLLYYRVLIQIAQMLVKKRESQIIFPLLCIAFAMLSISTLTLNVYVTLVFCSVGYLLERLEVPQNISFKSIYVFTFIAVIYLIVPRGYNTTSFYTFVSSLFVFLTAFQGNIESNPLEFYSRNSLNLLFIHYIVLNSCILLNIFIVDKFIINFIILLTVCTVILYLYEKSIEFVKSR